MPEEKKDNTDLLKEIRDNYRFYEEAWREIRDEAKTDMQYISGDPWDPKDRRIRESNDRPCMVWDELNPYINKLVNDPKKNKRAIQVNPKSGGADERTAEIRESIIREICYNSKAQTAFTTAFQGAAERSYGYARVGKKYVTAAGKTASTDAFNQELYIGRIPNPDSVLFDPNFKEIDASDAMGCYVTDIMRIEDFKRAWPNAQKVSFTTEDYTLAPQWIYENKTLQVAEYWRVTLEKKKIYLFKGKEEGPTAYYEDELPTGFDIAKADDSRSVDKRIVTQYITNGVEILDETEIEIPWIPIVPVFGKEIWVNDGSGSKRMLISLVRMARDPFMSYCFYRSQEAEEAGMTPKVPYIVYKGQINPVDREIWQQSNKVPRAFLEIEPILDATGQNVLPHPTRQPFTPNFQAYEVACESARRAIQTAMSGSVLPTQAQRMNEKSGVALKEIDAQEDQGTFHFIDNYNHFLDQIGRILDSWMDYVYDTKRLVGVRNKDESHASIMLNDPQNVNEETGEIQSTEIAGEHGVTVTVGPDFDSERDEQRSFVDTLIQEIPQIAPLLPPGAPAKVFAKAIRMKNLGPLGDEIADDIDPPADEAAKQHAIQQGQQQLQVQTEQLQKLSAENQQLKLEKAGRVIDNQGKAQIEGMKAASQHAIAKLDNDIQVLKALLSSKQNISDQEYETFRTVWAENHGSAHDVAMQSQQHAHEQDQAQQAAQQASQSQASDQMHQADMAQQAQQQPEQGDGQ